MSITGGGITSLQENIAAINTSLSELQSKGVVKNVQRGQVIISSFTDTVEKTIPISRVDLNRSILIVNIEKAEPSTEHGVSEVSLNTSEISVSVFGGALNGGKVLFAWQVIEFY